MSTENNKNTTWLIVGALLVLFLLGAQALQKPKEAAIPVTTTQETKTVEQPALDSTLVIEQELQTVDLGDIDAEIQTTESDLQSL